MRHSLLFGKLADLIQEIVKLIPGFQVLVLGGSKYFAAFKSYFDCRKESLWKQKLLSGPSAMNAQSSCMSVTKVSRSGHWGIFLLKIRSGSQEACLIVDWLSCAREKIFLRSVDLFERKT